MTVPLSEFDIDAVRATWVGKSLGGSVGRYPVEYEPIRRHCHMVQDVNPLYLDREYAASGPYGAVIVPPAMLLMHFSSSGVWPRRPRVSSEPRPPSFTAGVPTPGDRGINMSTSLEFLEPVVVGDQLRSERAIRDVYVKAIKLDPHAVWIITEIRILNQRDELVAVGNNTVLIHRSPSKIAEDAKSEVGSSET
jgi:acyl dehydratase